MSSGYSQEFREAVRRYKINFIELKRKVYVLFYIEVRKENLFHIKKFDIIIENYTLIKGECR